jgi:hypothetical protein
VDAEEFKQQRVKERQSGRFIEIDFSVERFAAQDFFGRRKPKSVVLVEMSGVKNSQHQSDHSQSHKYFYDGAASDLWLIRQGEIIHDFRARS